VCIQGLGFVGAAMSVAVASACSPSGEPLYDVIGVDQDTDSGRQRVADIEAGRFPFSAQDPTLIAKLDECHERGNLHATTDIEVYASADVVVIDVSLDIEFKDEEPRLDLKELKAAFLDVAKRVPEGALILVETTVPPGTCAKVLKPILEEVSRSRGLSTDAIYLAHSYERVMPGEHYFDSITNFWRVYAGTTTRAAEACERFLSTLIDVTRFPLSRLASTTASETAKVMENSYRSANIAFIDEWTKYAEKVGIDLFDVIDSIRVRPTHSNLRFPGLGVGGYCLTKDPAFAPAAVREIFGIMDLEFPFSKLAMKTNQLMPLHSVDRLAEMFGGQCKRRRVLLMGVSYRQDVGDTRFSPAETMALALIDLGMTVEAYDPFVLEWAEINVPLYQDLPSASGFDAVVFSTPHNMFREMDVGAWIAPSKPIILDTVNVLSKSDRDWCRAHGVRVESIGRAKGL
tara:strand:- start:5208 stop:6584 length:1377 start_codon:yes stop_codon:yes gene_type:complete